MKKKFVLQNLLDNKYWYGYYTNMYWTDDVKEARQFDDKEEIEDWIKNNFNELEGKFIITIEAWI
jgi:hypothetical protein